MKPAVICAATACAVFSSLLAGSERGSVEFYVAADGSDANPGTKEKPFRSLEGARDAIRSLKQTGSSKAPVTVWIRGGVYYRAQTFRLTQEDSGSKQAPIVYRAYEKERVRLVGGEEIRASWFEPVKDAAVLGRLDEAARGKVLQVNLRAHGITDYGELGSLTGGMKLFCNGKRMQLARWPNDGWALARRGKVIGLDENSVPQLVDEGRQCRTLGFKYTGKPPNRWRSFEGVWLRGYWQQEYQFDGWNPERVDTEKQEITLPWGAPDSLREWRRFYAINLLEEIDRSGEWYLDRKKGVLYFLPPEGPGKGLLLASMLEETMVALDNTSYVTVRGLTLEAARGTAVVVGGGTHNRIAGCIIRNVGQGVVLAGGTNNGVPGCDIYDVDGMGIRMSGGDRKTLTPANNYALNNHIHHYARCLKTWYPGLKIQGVGNRAAHNWIHHAPQYAISYEGNDHIIELNDLHDVCLEMSDVGVVGCGTDWTFRGNVVRYNFVHDIPERPYPGAKGVYLDNCASSTEIFGNVFDRVHQAAFIGGGRDNVIANNIFIECEEPVYLDNRGLRWNHFRPGGPMYDKLKAVNHDQPPWSSRYPKLARILDEVPQAPLGNLLVKNVSYRSSWRDPEEACRATFKNNIDKKYMTIEDNFVTDEDPGFVDAANMNFQLRDDSSVYRKIPGFKKIPFEKIGLYQDEYRPTWPIPGHRH